MKKFTNLRPSKKVYASILLILITASFSFFHQGCSTIDALSNVQRLQFKLGDINSFSLAGINLSNKSSISSFSITDGLKLADGFATGNLPATFTLNVLARNPNTPGGSKNTTSVLTKMDWTLLVDSKKTISGVVDSDVTIPGKGQTATIPINMSLNLMDFFKSQGYDGILNLALALGGVQGSAARVTLNAVPSMKIFGVYISGEEVTIVDKQFN